MNNLINFLTSKEIILVYIITFVACILCLIIYIVEKNAVKLKRRQNTKELNKLVEENNSLESESLISSNKVKVTTVKANILEQSNESKANSVSELIDSLVETENKKVMIDEKKNNSEDKLKTSTIKNNETFVEEDNKGKNILAIEKDVAVAEKESKVVIEDEQKNSLEEKLDTSIIKNNNAFENEAKKDDNIVIEKNESLVEKENKIEVEEQKINSDIDLVNTTNEVFDSNEKEYENDTNIVEVLDTLEDEIKKIDNNNENDTSIELLDNIEMDEKNTESDASIEVLEDIKQDRDGKKTNELHYTSIELDQESAKHELEKLTEELKNQENTNVSNIALTNYEEEQEENAIISLEELLKKSKEIYSANELTQYADEGNEPISLQDLEKRFEDEKINVEEINVKNDLKENISIEESYKSVDSLYENNKKFKSSPIISPIYGIEKTNNSELELENTANYEKLDEEIKKTNEFLMTLKELQKKLD